MKITEGQLRRIIREELAQNLDEMAYVKTLTGRDGKHVVLPSEPHWTTPAGSTSAMALDPETTSRYLGSKKFHDDAIRLYSKVPFNVWLAPLLSRNPDTSDRFIDPKFGYSRVKVLNLASSGMEFLEKTGFAGVEEIDPVNDLVVLPVGLNVLKGYTTSPWVIMHGIFDSLTGDGSIEELVPGITQLEKDINKNQSIIWDLVNSLTMHSATTNQIPLDATTDMVAEMMMQELFDKRGLHFNFDRLTDPDNRDQIIEIGKRVKELAPYFRDRAKGKLILVRQ